MSSSTRRRRKVYTVTKQREKWTEKQHEDFVQAIQLYGRQWKFVTEYVGTKTMQQIRSHAQKVFDRWRTQGKEDLIPPPILSSPSPSPPRAHTPPPIMSHEIFLQFYALPLLEQQGNILPF